MKKTIVFRILAVTLGLLLITVIAIPVQALPPDYTSFVYDWSWTEEDMCSFPLEVRFSGIEKDITFYSKDGTASGNFMVFPNSTWTWSANGKHVEARVNSPIHTQFLSDTQMVKTYLGTAIFIVVPSYGPVNGYAGKYTALYELDSEGNWVETQLSYAGTAWFDNWDAICEYLK